MNNLTVKLLINGRSVFRRSLCKRMPDSFELATGKEKAEILALQNTPDPWRMLPMKRGPGTKDNPNLIPSAYDHRIVGCLCHPEDMHIKYMYVFADEPRRCKCGYWFKLEKVEPIWKVTQSET